VQAMKAYCGSGDVAPLILNLGSRLWRASNPSCFCRSAHWVAGWVGPRVCLHIMETDISCCARNRTTIPGTWSL